MEGGAADIAACIDRSMVAMKRPAELIEEEGGVGRVLGGQREEVIGQLKINMFKVRGRGLTHQDSNKLIMTLTFFDKITHNFMFLYLQRKFRTCSFCSPEVSHLVKSVSFKKQSSFTD